MLQLRPPCECRRADLPPEVGHERLLKPQGCVACR
jgi:hypothetical protein